MIRIAIIIGSTRPGSQAREGGSSLQLARDRNCGLFLGPNGCCCFYKTTNRERREELWVR